MVKEGERRKRGERHEGVRSRQRRAGAVHTPPTASIPSRRDRVPRAGMVCAQDDGKRHILSIEAGLRACSYSVTLLVGAFEVFAGACVDLEDVARVYEEGDVDADPGLALGGLRASLCGVAADARGGLGGGGRGCGGERSGEGLG